MRCAFAVFALACSACTCGDPGPGDDDAGTVVVVHDGGLRAIPGLSTALNPATFAPFELVPFRGGALMLVQDDAHGCEPWFTDGTDAGTRLIADLTLGPVGSCDRDAPARDASPVVVGDRAWMLLEGPLPGDTQLWSTDGTAEGTGRFGLPFALAPQAAVPSYGQRTMPFFAGSMLLARSGDAKLWRVFPDAGAVPLMTPSAPLKSFVALGEQVFFTEGPLLWKTDGTAGGTVRVLGHRPYSALAVLDGGLFYGGEAIVLDAGVGPQGLWRSGGADFDAVRMNSQSFDPTGSIAATLGNRAVIAFRQGLVSTDGTAAGTRSIPGTWQAPVSPLVLGQRLLFSTDPSTSLPFFGDDVHATDGVTVEKVVTGRVAYLTELGTQALYLRLDTRAVESTAGTAPLVTVETGISVGPYNTWFGAIDGGAVFIANNALFRTDGTPAGTQEVWAPGPQASAVDAVPLFALPAGAAINRPGLPFTNGTTVRPMDRSDAGLQVCGVAGAHVYASTYGTWGVSEGAAMRIGADAGAFFLCESGTACGEAWCAIDFAIGRVLALYPDGGFVEALRFSPGNVVQLTPSDRGVFVFTTDARLSFFDATTRASRTMPGPFSGSLERAVARGETLFQLVRHNATNSCALFQTDATEAGTRQLTTLVTDGCRFGLAGDVPLLVAAGAGAWTLYDARTSPPTALQTGFAPTTGVVTIAEVGQRLAIRVDPWVGPVETWLTDGTAAGTGRVTGAELWSLPLALGADRLVAAGGTAQTGNELVLIDLKVGRVATVIREVWPGVGSSNPNGMGVAGSRVFFTAFDGTARSLHAIDLP